MLSYWPGKIKSIPNPKYPSYKFHRIEVIMCKRYNFFFFFFFIVCNNLYNINLTKIIIDNATIMFIFLMCTAKSLLHIVLVWAGKKRVCSNFSDVILELSSVNKIVIVIFLFSVSSSSASCHWGSRPWPLTSTPWCRATSSCRGWSWRCHTPQASGRTSSVECYQLTSSSRWEAHPHEHIVKVSFW